jgi:SAM-dependent methyltransferase
VKESNYNYKTHWDNAYKKNSSKNLGWFESDPKLSIELIEKCNLNKNSVLFNAGAGTSKLIKILIKKGFKNIIINDISSIAIKKLQKKLQNKPSIKFIQDDLTNPKKLLKINKVDLWHDRAVLHFFKEKYQQENYFNLLKKVVKKDGHVILCEFNLGGAKKCCGLDIFNYDKKMLIKKLGKDFVLLEAINYTYKHPYNGNKREYIYTLFKRINYN